MLVFSLVEVHVTFSACARIHSGKTGMDKYFYNYFKNIFAFFSCSIKRLFYTSPWFVSVYPCCEAPGKVPGWAGVLCACILSLAT